jgi:hypothetical protein
LREQVGRVAIDYDAARRPEVVLAESAAEDADRLQTHLAGGLGIIRRVADDNRLIGLHALELVEGRLEDVGMGLRFLCVVRRRRDVDEILDPSDLLVALYLLGFPR